MNDLPQHVKDTLSKLPQFPAKGKLLKCSISAVVTIAGDPLAGMAITIPDYAREQRILRAHHGSRDEYVWSDTLRGHVRIGPPA